MTLFKQYYYITLLYLPLPLLNATPPSLFANAHNLCSCFSCPSLWGYPLCFSFAPPKGCLLPPFGEAGQRLTYPSFWPNAHKAKAGSFMQGKPIGQWQRLEEKAKGWVSLCPLGIRGDQRAAFSHLATGQWEARGQRPALCCFFCLCLLNASLLLIFITFAFACPPATLGSRTIW
jgi:hypothetical protein